LVPERLWEMIYAAEKKWVQAEGARPLNRKKVHVNKILPLP
jgi:hypothetical protein